MFLRSSCGCLLCRIESNLLRELTYGSDGLHLALLASSDELRRFPSVPALLSDLRSSQADPRSDKVFRALFTASQTAPQSVEMLFVLAFLPMLHGTVRRVAKQQPGLSSEDVAQQALHFLLDFIRSEQLRRRTSHLAFVISRTLKRRMFLWANHEGVLSSVRMEGNGEDSGSPAMQESFERHAILLHFLDRCATKQLLSDAERDLLIQFRLDGNKGEFPVGTSVQNSSNAHRQKLKRLLAKLRRLAS
jgi:hypothetical protein